MNSPPHRANILDKEVNSVGIAVVQSGNVFFAVEDFSYAVADLSLADQEKQVIALLAARGLHSGHGNSGSSEDLHLGPRLCRP